MSSSSAAAPLSSSEIATTSPSPSPSTTDEEDPAERSARDTANLSRTSSFSASSAAPFVSRRGFDPSREELIVSDTANVEMQDFALLLEIDTSHPLIQLRVPSNASDAVLGGAAVRAMEADPRRVVCLGLFRTRARAEAALQWVVNTVRHLVRLKQLRGDLVDGFWVRDPLTGEPLSIAADDGTIAHAALRRAVWKAFDLVHVHSSRTPTTFVRADGAVVTPRTVPAARPTARFVPCMDDALMFLMQSRGGSMDGWVEHAAKIVLWHVAVQCHAVHQSPSDWSRTLETASASASPWSLPPYVVLHDEPSAADKRIAQQFLATGELWRHASHASSTATATATASDADMQLDRSSPFRIVSTPKRIVVWRFPSTEEIRTMRVLRVPHFFAVHRGFPAKSLRGDVASTSSTSEDVARASTQRRKRNAREEEEEEGNHAHRHGRRPSSSSSSSSQSKRSRDDASSTVSTTTDARLDAIEAKMERMCELMTQLTAPTAVAAAASLSSLSSSSSSSHSRRNRASNNDERVLVDDDFTRIAMGEEETARL